MGALSACAAPVPVSVDDVISHIEDWHGKVVTVDGWLGTCGGYDCHIFGSAADMNAARTLQAGSAEWRRVFDRGISVGSGMSFDRSASKVQHSHVQLKARINKECRLATCFDRADVLQPISIDRVE